MVRIRVDALDEGIGIVGRRADEGENGAGRGLHGDDRTAPFAQRLLGQGLELGIDTQVEVLAGHRRDALEDAQRASVRVGLDLFEPDLAEQGFFVARLEAQLADVLHAAISRLVDLVLFLFVDASDVTEEMHPEARERVVPPQARLEFHAAEIRPLDRQPRRFFLGEVRAQHEIFESRPFAQLFAEILEVRLIQAHDLAQLLEQCIHVVDLLGDDLQRVHRIILREDDTVAIEDQAARRLDRDRLDAVGLRQRFVVAMREHLQVGQTQDQREDQRDDDDADHR